MKVINGFGGQKRQSFENHYLIRLLSKKYKVIDSDEPDFVISGEEKSDIFKYDCVRIFFNIENTGVDFNIYDYSIDFDFMIFEDRHIRAPFMVFCNTYSQDSILNKHIIHDGGGRGK